MRRASYRGRITEVAKLSISVPDELAADLHAFAPENVSAFVSTAIRHELDRRRLYAFLDELQDELGPVDEDEVAVFNAMFADTAAAKAPGKPRRSTVARKARPRAAS
jgi:post-segregation antitoxin (ccd killing protein)